MRGFNRWRIWSPVQGFAAARLFDEELPIRMTTATSQTAAATAYGNPALGTSVLQRIGNTPLILLERVVAHLPWIKLLGKAEWANPGGSVKDRPASAIVQDAFDRAELGPTRPGRGLLDATSGNTGIAYAMLGAALGFPVTLCMPSNVSPERKKILDAFGAEIIYTDPGEGSDGALIKA